MLKWEQNHYQSTLRQLSLQQFTYSHKHSTLYTHSHSLSFSKTSFSLHQASIHGGFGFSFIPFHISNLLLLLLLFYFSHFNRCRPASQKNQTVNPRRNGEFIVEFVEYFRSALSMARTEMGFHWWISINMYRYLITSMVEYFALERPISSSPFPSTTFGQPLRHTSAGAWRTFDSSESVPVR